MSALKHRMESFGGILALEEPPMLVHVDRDFMLGLGCEPSPLWSEKEKSHLSAPLEVHLSVTNRCSKRCGHCYMDSGERDAAELSGEAFRRAVDLLADMGVFHMALGGGEALERADFFDLAAYVRERGIVPNLTTNGLLITRETAERCRVFGQVNVTVDWPEDMAAASGSADEEFANRAAGVDLLLEAGVRVGLNCVVTRQNFDHIPALVAFAAETELTDVEFLRFKPSGRGRRHYYEKRLTPGQNIALYPMLNEIGQRCGIPLKIDCSFVPMFCRHNPDREMMERFSVYGCEAGNVLLGVRSDGRFAGCSFLAGEESIFDLHRLWDSSEQLSHLRGWTSRAIEPCRSCSYLDICKGGCRAVSAFVAGDPDAPDPECPFVVELSAG